MKNLILILFCVLILSSAQYSQTQLLRIGNAVQYSYEGNSEWIILTTKKVTFNGKEYFERKYYQPWFNLNASTNSYERIEGDSAYYVFNQNNQDSLLFNFNWQIGKKFFTTSDGNILNGQRIDSIVIKDTFLSNDTVYVLRNFSFNTSTGDTNYNVIPEYNHLSKKCGKLNEGMWIYLTGVKIDGVRYGSLYPYPEEIVFSEDSIYIPTLSDSGSTKIINASDYAVKVDSIISVGSFCGYWGNFNKPGFEYPFYLVQSVPGFMGDTLGIIIPPHDSINVSFYEVDLCPICDYEVQNYFIDTLRYVFTYMDGNVYLFSKSIQISGEGHPSDVESEGVLPGEFALYQNYPNPFNPSTKISWQSPVSSWQTLSVYDVLGNEVATLVNEYRNAGNYEINFDASKLSSGVYYYQIRAGSFVETKKMIYLK
ncbi:MAG: T9SS type A sorting domain-containing protein [Ignavibacterium sp.]|nr:T9SS type A sorting domain-containing protein [Ignavibacterium sp.]